MSYPSDLTDEQWALTVLHTAARGKDGPAGATPSMVVADAGAQMAPTMRTGPVS